MRPWPISPKLKTLDSVFQALLTVTWKKASYAVMPMFLYAQKGDTEFGTRCEVKNLNSFRYVKQSIQYEIARQVAIIENGGTIQQETRLFNTGSGTTASLRSKEEGARLPLFSRA